MQEGSYAGGSKAQGRKAFIFHCWLCCQLVTYFRHTVLARRQLMVSLVLFYSDRLRVRAGAVSAIARLVVIECSEARC